ncbi:MAG: penicillin-binding protein 1A [Hyphomicrobiaceae bacterium]
MVMFVGGAAIAGVVLWYYAKDLPDYDRLARYEPPVMTRIHASDGSLIAEYARERRIFVPLNTVPKLVIGAFLSAEDKNFWTHGGVDFTGIARAVLAAAKGGRLTGASTITQQVAKNFLLTNERSFERKIKEAILAVRIEHTFSKERILELYLNEIFLGLGSYGVAAASLNYFGKELKDLTVAEAAYLASLPKAPNNYHPFKHEQAALIRRNWVIGQMLANGYITQEQHDEAIAAPLGVNLRPFGAHIFAAEFFAEDVRRLLISMYGEEGLYAGGLSVRTTLDPVFQAYAKEALTEGLVAFDRERGWRGPVRKIDLAAEEWGAQLGRMEAWSDIDPWRLGVVLDVAKDKASVGLQPYKLASGAIETDRVTGILPASGASWAGAKKKGLGKIVEPGDVVYLKPIKDKEGQYELMQVPEVEGALTVMDPHTGRVLALVGGFSFAASQFDRASQARRQPGSSFKPFVYAAALDNGYTPSSVILDAPFELKQTGSQEVWKPENYSGKYYGPSTLRTGIEFSRNLMTVRLAQDIGMPLVAEYARRFGVYDDMLPVLSMALGAGETTLLRLATGYCSFANGGRQVTATLIDRIQDRNGRTVWRHDDRECTGCEAADWAGQPEPELPDDRRQIIDPHTAYQITSMMEGVVQRGTATVLKDLDVPIAGKTGTTNDEKDAWFVGFTPDLVVGAYVGFDTPKPMGKGATGGHLAAPIVRSFLERALAGKAAVPFRIPPGLKLVRINRRTGARASSGDPDSILEAFKPDTDPPEPFALVGPETTGTGSWGTTQSGGSSGGLF